MTSDYHTLGSFDPPKKEGVEGAFRDVENDRTAQDIKERSLRQRLLDAADRIGDTGLPDEDVEALGREMVQLSEFPANKRVVRKMAASDILRATVPQLTSRRNAISNDVLGGMMLTQAAALEYQEIDSALGVISMVTAGIRSRAADVIGAMDQAKERGNG